MERINNLIQKVMLRHGNTGVVQGYLCVCVNSRNVYRYRYSFNKNIYKFKTFPRYIFIFIWYYIPACNTSYVKYKYSVLKNGIFITWGPKGKTRKLYKKPPIWNNSSSNVITHSSVPCQHSQQLEFEKMLLMYKNLFSWICAWFI